MLDNKVFPEKCGSRREALKGDDEVKSGAPDT